MKYLFDIDLFGKEPNLYYKGKSQKNTKIGKRFTIIHIILFVSYLIYKLIRMLKRKDVIFYDSYAYDKEIFSINLTKENFNGAFNVGGLIDETIYYIKAYYVSEVKNEVTKREELEIEICNKEKFGSKYKELFKNESLNETYCLKNVNQTLEGYSYLGRFSYFNLQIYPCVNQTRDGRPCKDYNILYNFFIKSKVEFKMQDNILTPEDYKIPVKPSKKDITCPIFLHLYQQTYSYIQIVRVETDEDITGIKLNPKNNVEVFTKYQDSFVIAAPGTDEILKTGGPVCDLTLQLAANVLTQRRNYKTLLDVMEEVGGLMEFLYAIFKMILYFVINESYEKSLVNNLFSFDIKRKVIIFKNKNQDIKNYINDSERKDDKNIHDNKILKKYSSRNISMTSNQLSNKDLTKAFMSTLPILSSDSDIFITKKIKKYEIEEENKSEKYKKERVDKGEKYEIVGENKSEKYEIVGENKSEKYEKEKVDKNEKYEIVGENKSEKFEIVGENKSEKYEKKEANKSEKYEKIGENKSGKYKIVGENKSEEYEKEEEDKNEKYEKEGIDKNEKYEKEEVDENKNYEKVGVDENKKYEIIGENKSEKFEKKEEDKNEKYEKEEVDENKNYEIIENINKICLCLRNKKINIEKIFFEEGMKLIKEKLDISNLFINSLIVSKKIEELSIGLDNCEYISRKNGKYIENILQKQQKNHD